MMVRNGLNPDPMPYTLKLLVIHCTATPAGREVSAEEIRRWHTAPPNEGGRGWKQVGYTDLVHLDGVERDGKTPRDTRTSEQRGALEAYVKDFHRRFPHVRIVGHNELAAKACPSFDVQEWLFKIGINNNSNVNV